MDRAGGRGQPPTQSDLPHVLHGSLIIPSENWEDNPPLAEGPRAGAAATPVDESPQQVSYSYTPSPFEEGSSRGSRTSQGYFDPDADHPPPPKRRRAAGSSERLHHAYQAGPSTAVGSHLQPVYQPRPSTQRLPGISSLEAGPAGLSPVRSPPPPLQQRRHGPLGADQGWDDYPFRPEIDDTSATSQAQFPAVEYRTPTQQQIYQAYNPVAAPDPRRTWVPFAEAAVHIPRSRSRSVEAHLSASRSSIPEYSQTGRSEYTYPPSPVYGEGPRGPTAHQISRFSTLTPHLSRAQIPPYPAGYASRSTASTSAEIAPAPPYDAAASRLSDSPEIRVASTVAGPRPTYLADQWSDSQARSGSERPASSQPTERSVTAASKKRVIDSDDDEDGDEPVPPRKVPRKTAIACNFCRRRKLKCDGLTPSCQNCDKRREPCTYVPFAKRRGPGKAPKGQRKARLETERRLGEEPGGSASGQAQGSVHGVPYAETGAAPGPGPAHTLQLAAPTPLLAAGSYVVYPLASPDAPPPPYGAHAGSPPLQYGQAPPPRVDPGPARARTPITLPSLRLGGSPSGHAPGHAHGGGGGGAGWSVDARTIASWDAGRVPDVWGRRGSRDESGSGSGGGSRGRM